MPPNSAPCSHKVSCPMFVLLKKSGSLKVWQANYCDADYNRCARYQRSEAGQPVPRNLMPNGIHLGV